MTLDHLVVGCCDLAQGEAWARHTLGVELQPGGRHALMGTHNRLLNLGEGIYLEVIAIDPDGEPPLAGRKRWFDLDSPALQARLAQAPALIHAVFRVPDLDAALARWADPGFEAVSASRGTLSWRIAVRADGRRVPGRPALIQWGEAHPTDALPQSAVRLAVFTPSQAVLETPCGEVHLDVLP